MVSSSARCRVNGGVMRLNRKIAVALLLVSSAAFVGCGGGAEGNQHISSGSEGQELEELKKALDQGAIDQKNYEKLQKLILKRGYRPAPEPVARVSLFGRR